MRTVKYSFSGGEYAEEVQHRSDIELYDLGAKRLLNAAVNYGGGAFKRRGLQFAEFLTHGDEPIRLMEFRFSDDLDNTYLVIFGSGYVRFMQNRAYVLDAPISLTGKLTEAVITITDHGYKLYDLVYLSSQDQVFLVNNPTTHTFTLETIHGHGFAGVTEDDDLYHVTQLENPYAPADLREVGYAQYYDEVRLTHIDYPTYILERGEIGWTLTEEDRTIGKPIGGSPTIEDSGAYISYVKAGLKGTGYTRDDPLVITDPNGVGFQGYVIAEDGGIEEVVVVKEGHGYTNPSADVTSSGGSGATFEIGLADTDAGFVVAVSAVLPSGRETGIMRPRVIRNSIDFTQTKGFARYSWNRPSGLRPIKYRVYRSIVVPDGQDVHIGYALGLIGEVRGTEFTDNNITPDFTQTPIIYRDPFAPGAVSAIVVNAEGSGYGDTDTLSLSGGGTGFLAYPVVRAGKIIGVYIANPGEGYSGTPTLTVGTSGGSGATFTVTLAPEEGTYPSTSTRFQRRWTYAGTRNEPMKIWASRQDELGFAYNEVPTASDPYDYTMDSGQVTPIRHILAAKQGLMIFTPGSVELLRGPDGKAVTGTEGFLDPQSYVGSSPIRPELVGDDILYIQDKFNGLQLFTYEPAARSYQSREISILARHFFSNHSFSAMAFAYASEKRGYLIRDDGSCIMVTIDKDQNINGFSQFTTHGRIIDVVALDVGNEEHVYFHVQRVIGGLRLHSIETILPEASDEPEDAIYLDSSITVAKVYPQGFVTASGIEGEIILSVVPAIFTSGDVGKHVGLAGGRGIVTEFIDVFHLRVQMTRPITEYSADIIATTEIAKDTWWMQAPISQVTNVHLEGETVSIIADGKIQAPKVVTGGVVELDDPAAIVTVGLPYRCEIITLEIAPNGDDELEGATLNLNEVRIAVRRAGVFQVGAGDDPEGKLWDMLYRTDEAWVEPTRLRQKPKWLTVPGGWESEGAVVRIVQDNGLPLEITKIALDVSAGR